MVAFTGFNRPNTYIISTTGSNQLRQVQVPSTITTTTDKNTKMKATTTIMVKQPIFSVKTLAVANSPTKVPTTANVIKTTVSSPVHRFLSPKQSVTLSSTNTTSSLQQKKYSSTSTTPSTLNSSSWTTLLGQNSNGYSDSDDSNHDQNSPSPSPNNSNCGEPKKRRRLTHLSPEEKILRRKLKNRVAAQTARDRKKAQMNDMEETIANLQAENKRLMQYNSTLQKKAYELATENAELQHRLGLLENGECNVSSSGESASLVKTEPKSPRSAEPSVPQLKKQALILSHLIMQLTSFLSLVIYSHFSMKCTTQTLIHPLTIAQLFQQQQGLVKEKKKWLLVQHSVHIQWWGPHQHNWTPSMN